MGKLLKFLEELVAIFEVHLPELFPSSVLNLLAGVLPEPSPKG